MSKVKRYWAGMLSTSPDKECGDDDDYFEVIMATDYAALEAENKRLRGAALAVWSGWEGQHEMGEMWHDEVKDMDALGKALATPAPKPGEGKP